MAQDSLTKIFVLLRKERYLDVEKKNVNSGHQTSFRSQLQSVWNDWQRQSCLLHKSGCHLMSSLDCNWAEDFQFGSLKALSNLSSLSKFSPHS